GCHGSGRNGSGCHGRAALGSPVPVTTIRRRPLHRRSRNDLPSYVAMCCCAMCEFFPLPHLIQHRLQVHRRLLRELRHPPPRPPFRRAAPHPPRPAPPQTPARAAPPSGPGHQARSSPAHRPPPPSEGARPTAAAPPAAPPQEPPPPAPWARVSASPPANRG